MMKKNLTRNLRTIHQMTTPQAKMMNQVMTKKMSCVILVLAIYLMEHRGQEILFSQSD